jgi:hypothetical protein
MEAKKIIRDAVTHVTLMRHTAIDKPGLALAISQIKNFQARRFAGTYFDLLASDQYKKAALFFLEELYSDKDYSERDAQFVRMAGALERIFPKQVVQTAVSLAQLHSLTEELDQAMAEEWMVTGDQAEVARYVLAWRRVGRRADRDRQLATVMSIGNELNHLTHTPGLRAMLRMMRGPAKLARLGALQRFLESGFDTFAEMGREDDGAKHFLGIVTARESELITHLFEANAVTCETKILQLLGQTQ